MRQAAFLLIPAAAILAAALAGPGMGDGLMGAGSKPAASEPAPMGFGEDLFLGFDTGEVGGPAGQPTAPAPQATPKTTPPVVATPSSDIVLHVDARGALEVVAPGSRTRRTLTGPRDLSERDYDTEERALDEILAIANAHPKADIRIEAEGGAFLEHSMVYIFLPRMVAHGPAVSLHVDGRAVFDAGDKAAAPRDADGMAKINLWRRESNGVRYSKLRLRLPSGEEMRVKTTDATFKQQVEGLITRATWRGVASVEVVFAPPYNRRVPVSQLADIVDRLRALTTNSVVLEYMPPLYMSDRILPKFREASPFLGDD